MTDMSITINHLLLYADPGSGALILQILAASLLGGLFYIRKIKDKIFQMFAVGKRK